VTVTLREKVAKARLDLGPFRREVAWQSDAYPGDKVETEVTGTVRGEVQLAPAGTAGIDMGTISPSKPRTVDFTLESSDPDTQLTVDEEKSLRFLEVEMLDGKEGSAAGTGKRWRGRVVFRTDSLFRGLFPKPENRDYDSVEKCCLVFFITPKGQTSQPARRILVPIQGDVLRE
jgi:hypothetical protein